MRPLTHWHNQGRVAPFSLLSHGAEIVLAHAAEGADPVGRDVLESGAGGDIAVGVAFGGVIDITADVANVLFHFSRVLKLNNIINRLGATALSQPCATGPSMQR